MARLRRPACFPYIIDNLGIVFRFYYRFSLLFMFVAAPKRPRRNSHYIYLVEHVYSNNNIFPPISVQPQSVPSVLSLLHCSYRCCRRHNHSPSKIKTVYIAVHLETGYRLQWYASQLSITWLFFRHPNTINCFSFVFTSSTSAV